MRDERAASRCERCDRRVGRARRRWRARPAPSAAYWLAERGHRVLVVEKKRFPREKTCGDGLTPRAVRQLHDMGLADPLAEFQRYDGLRSIAHGITLELALARAPRLPALRLRGAAPRPRRDGRRPGGEGRRHALAGHRGDRAARRGRPGHRGGRRAGKDSGTTETVRARYVVVADGANSRFGRALGTARDRTTPWAWRFAATSPARSTTSPGSRATSTCATGTATTCPGYGWIFPVGDGTVNVGVGLPRHLHRLEGRQHAPIDGRVRRHRARRAGASRPRPSCGAADRRQAARPGGSVTPKVGPTWLVVGDAAGSINPFNGEGISLRLRDRPARRRRGRRGARTGDGLALAAVPASGSSEVYGLYFKVARTFVQAIGNPAVMRELTRVGMHSRTLMEWVLRIMANLLRPDEIGPAEAAYRTLSRIVAVTPGSVRLSDRFARSTPVEVRAADAGSASIAGTTDCRTTARPPERLPRRKPRMARTRTHVLITGLIVVLPRRERRGFVAAPRRERAGVVAARVARRAASTDG